MVKFLLNNKLLNVFITGCAGALIALSISVCPFTNFYIRGLDYVFSDSWMRLSASGGQVPIILVTIDDNSINHVGPWPWRRSTYGKIVDVLARSGARLVGIGLLLDRERPSDPIFARAIKRVPTVLPVYAPETGGEIHDRYGLKVRVIRQPSPILSKAAAILGHTTLVYDSDGVIRRVPAFIYDSNASFASMGIGLAALWKGINLNDLVLSHGRIRLGSLNIPLDRHGFFLIRYLGPPGSFPRVSAWDVLQGGVPQEVFSGKIVLVGVTATGISDQWTTPFARKGGMVGVEVLANITNTFLGGKIPYEISASTTSLLTIVLGLLGGIISQSIPIKWALATIFAGTPLIWLAGAVCLKFFWAIIPMTPMTISWNISIIIGIAAKAYVYRAEVKRQKDRIKKIIQVKDTSSLEDLCSIIAETAGAECVIGIFKGLEGGHRVHFAGKQGLVPFEDIDRLAGDDDLERAVTEWIRTREGRWQILPVESGPGLLGLYLLLLPVDKDIPRDRLEQARDVANGTALILEHRMLLEKIEKEYMGTLDILLDALARKAPGLLEHSRHVAEIARGIAIRMGIGQDEVDLIYKAGLLHDIGLTGVPDMVLMKQDALSAEERIWIESHPVIGAEMVSKAPQLAACAPLIRQHHERYDGKGYPDGLAQEEISLGGRILAVAEAFVSIMEKEIQASPDAEIEDLKEHAMSEVQRRAGSQFDATVVKIILEMKNSILCG